MKNYETQEPKTVGAGFWHIDILWDNAIRHL